MNERGQGTLWFAPIIVLAVLIIIGALIAVGPSLGGMPGEVHRALHDLLTGDDRAIVDKTVPLSTSGTYATTSIPVPASVPTIPLMIALPLAPTPTPGTPCAAFSFAGALSIQGGRVSFGRFNVVSSTDPYGQNDPLASWKLIQFGGFLVDREGIGAGRSLSATIPVDQTVNMLIADPFSGEMLFSARCKIEEIDVWGSSASINSRLEANLSEIRVNNAIGSDTLACFAGQVRGVLVMHFECAQDVMPALRRGEPIYAPMSGTVHAERCIR